LKRKELSGRVLEDISEGMTAAAIATNSSLMVFKLFTILLSLLDFNALN
jgi:hypothetical protein